MIERINPFLFLIIGTSFTWLITALGASLVFFFKKKNTNILEYMMAFASGIMISASFYSLLEPGAELAEKLNLNSTLIISLGFLTGAFFIIVLDKIIEKIKYKNNKKYNKNIRKTILLVVAITLHNIPEGLAIGVAFGSNIKNIMGAIILTIGIGIQNFPEGAAVSIPLRKEGYGRKKAFMYGQLSGIVEPIFGIIGFILVKKIKFALPFFLSFAAGAMIYVALVEILTEIKTENIKRNIGIFIILGFLIMMILDTYFN